QPSHVSHLFLPEFFRFPSPGSAHHQQGRRAHHRHDDQEDDRQRKRQAGGSQLPEGAGFGLALFPHGARQILKRRGERIPAPPHVDQNRRRKTLRFRNAAAPSELLQGGGHGLAPVHRLQRRRQLRRKRV